jgi:hypothetical protein
MAEENKALIPVEQKVVEFYGDELTAVLVDVGGQSSVYIPVRPICDFLGVDWSSQRQHINRDPVLSQEFIPF